MRGWSLGENNNDGLTTMVLSFCFLDCGHCGCMHLIMNEWEH